MKNDKSTIKFYSESTYVDIETGEIITKSKFEREYYKIRSNKKTIINENHGIIKHTIECRRNGQQKLF